MENQYEYDDFLFTALSIKCKPVEFMCIKEIFNTMSKIDKHSFCYEYELGLNEIELEMKEIFISREEELGDDIIFILSTVLIKNVVNYFYKIGISINKDIKLSELNSVINSFYSLLNIDSNLKELCIDIINNDELNLSESLVELLNIFNTIKDERCYEIILSVDYKTIDSIKEYINNLFVVNEEENEMLIRLISLDSKYRQTSIVKEYLKDGYVDNTIESIIDSMYSVLEKNNDIEMLPYEVVATFTLCIDTRYKIEESIDKYFNIEVFNYSIEEQSNIKTRIEELVYEIDKRL